MRVLDVRVIDADRLWLRFSDGAEGVAEIPLAGDAALQAVFAEARCNGLTVEWPGGIDYCPDALRGLVEAQKNGGFHAGAA